LATPAPQRESIGVHRESCLRDVPSPKFPRHVAIIMDGNGRWAKARGFPREAGHRAGAAVVRTITEEAVRLGLGAITLYSFSLENWKRPAGEVEALMLLCEAYLDGEREQILRENIRFRAIGRRDGLPARIVERLNSLERESAANTGLTLCLAINYGSRAEITDAMRAIAKEVREGTLDPASIDESTIAEHLYTGSMGDLADPDLLIRTAGEMRVSNYLLWQISYAEIHVTRTLWPDFAEADLHAAIRDYASRHRRFGGLDAGAPAPHDPPARTPQ
jgi:undecaprenyl diphosphate synthase